jgi:hypothetical protein
MEVANPCLAMETFLRRLPRVRSFFHMYVGKEIEENNLNSK